MSEITKVLVLDKSWLPFAVCGHYDALCKVFAGRARTQAVSVSDDSPVFRTARGDHDVDRSCPVCDSTNVNRVGVTSARACGSCGSRFRIGVTGHLEIFKPSVIVMNEYKFRDKHNSVRFSKRNLFARDGFKCAYCDVPVVPHELTIDHVIPKSHKRYDRENGSSWMNCVASCKPCNNRKGDRTPEEADMPLLIRPHVPAYAPRFYIRKEIRFADDSWWDFLGKKEDWVH